MLVFVGCIVGVINVMGSTRSYSSTLSTVRRTSRSKALDQLIRITDRNGRNPLPKRLARTKVRLATLYGTSVALDGENFAIEIVGSPSGGMTDDGTRHTPRGGRQEERRLGVQRVEERDGELENLPTTESQDHHRGIVNAKDQPSLLAKR